MYVRHPRRAAYNRKDGYSTAESNVDSSLLSSFIHKAYRRNNMFRPVSRPSSGLNFFIIFINSKFYNYFKFQNNLYSNEREILSLQTRSR